MNLYKMYVFNKFQIILYIHGISLVLKMVSQKKYICICKIYNMVFIVSGLWNHVFLFSNLSLFVFLPFAYLFSESTGFPGCRGLRGRVYETFIVLALLGVAMLGLAYVISAWLEGDRSSIDALLSKWYWFS